MLAADIENKNVLEVACGAAGFSVSAARIAHRVDCIDLDDSRLNPMVAQSNVCFQIMDACQMEYQDQSHTEDQQNHRLFSQSYRL